MTERKAEETARLARLLDLLGETGDILEGRVYTPDAPAWCRTRGWDAYLSALDDDELKRAEAEGLGALLADAPHAPESLRSLAARVLELTRITEADAPPRPPRAMRRVSQRKREQLESLSMLARRHLRRPQRIVDVGAGLGHLTRLLSEDLGCAAVGLEREADRVDKARALGDHEAAFERWDGTAEPLTISEGDLVVGLHACGDLGDVVVESAARAGADLLLVSCCLQKIRAPQRAPRSALGKARDFRAPKTLLGLANVSTRPIGVETTMEAIMASRETRHALRLLLEARGVACAPGEEAHGINRRQMNRGLAAVAPKALSVRGLPPATDEELERARREGRREFSRIRRYSLPRAMLGRVLEVGVVADRAAALEDAGHEARVLAAFGDAASPRNLTIVARGPGGLSPSGESAR